MWSWLKYSNCHTVHYKILSYFNWIYFSKCTCFKHHQHNQHNRITTCVTTVLIMVHHTPKKTQKKTINWMQQRNKITMPVPGSMWFLRGICWISSAPYDSTDYPPKEFLLQCQLFYEIMLEPVLACQKLIVSIGCLPGLLTLPVFWTLLFGFALDVLFAYYINSCLNSLYVNVYFDLGKFVRVNFQVWVWVLIGP